jgi:hypothetical protein
MIDGHVWHRVELSMGFRRELRRIRRWLGRFNPDAYTDHAGVPCHTTCFSFDKNGMPRVAPRKTKEWKHRLDTLLELVRACKRTAPVKEVTIHHLFYSGLQHNLGHSDGAVGIR